MCICMHVHTYKHTHTYIQMRPLTDKGKKQAAVARNWYTQDVGVTNNKVLITSGVFMCVCVCVTMHISERERKRRKERERERDAL